VTGIGVAVIPYPTRLLGNGALALLTAYVRSPSRYRAPRRPLYSLLPITVL